jgi:Fic family protein
MEPAAFIAPEAGRLVPTLEGQLAFVPAPLPPRIDLGAIALDLAIAMQALGELKGACRRLQNHQILIRPLQRNEALTSSAMEGTFTTDENLLRAEAGIEDPGDDSTREVFNYQIALNDALNLLSELPISHRIVKQTHKDLLSGLSAARGASKRPGEYKNSQNWIGGRTIDVARFIPPPPRETQECMDELERYINRENTGLPPPLVDLALVHYQFEAIHPFADGNGRVGRMLISLMAINSGLLDVPILYMSPELERHKDEYIDRMFNVSTLGDWTSWINFFCNRVCESCRDSILAADRLINLQAEYRARASGVTRSASTLTLIDILFDRTAITITEAAGRLGVTYPAAKNAIDRLVDLGILKEVSGAYPKIYYAPGILRASRPVDMPRQSR